MADLIAPMMEKALILTMQRLRDLSFDATPRAFPSSTTTEASSGA